MIDLSDIAYLPVDLPQIPNKAGIVQAFQREFSFGWWDAVRLFEPTKDFEPTDKWSDAANTRYPDLKQWMSDHLPYSAHIHAKLMKTRDLVLPHVDYLDPNRQPDVYRHLVQNEPASYRLIISGNRTGSLYLCKSVDSAVSDRVYPILPDDTDVYAMPYTNQVHGVDFENDRVMVITNGYIDVSRHQDLLKRSMEKYGDYLIRRSDLR